MLVEVPEPLRGTYSTGEQKICRLSIAFDKDVPKERAQALELVRRLQQTNEVIVIETGVRDEKFSIGLGELGFSTIVRLAGVPTADRASGRIAYMWEEPIPHEITPGGELRPPGMTAVPPERKSGLRR